MANYQTVKDGIGLLLNALGYMESSEVIDFKNAPVNEYASRYILKCLSGENQNNTVIDRFEDAQEWQIQVAFARSSQNDITNYDMAQRAKDAIIKSLDKPSNWVSFVKILKYNKWELIETPNYFVIDIRLTINDEYVHG